MDGSPSINDCTGMKEEQALAEDRLPDLLRQISEGRQTAFRQVYELFYKRLFLFAFAIVKVRELAEEIVEDVFVKLWQKHTAAPAIQNLRVYLYTATKNTALNYLAKKAKESITEPFDHIHIGLNGSAISPEQILITAEMFKKIGTAVEALPPRCKMIFKLVREDGLRYKEVAEILNISVNTIDTQMAIAVKRIASTLLMEFDLPLPKTPARK
jgi:RNA polymerase sigma-70 factor (family 1)